MMKRILKYMIVATALCCSCQKAAEKTEVEAGFADGGRVPRVGIAEKVDVYQYEKRVSATVLVSGIDPEMTHLEVGLLSSQDEYFSDPKAVYAKRQRNGSYTLRVPVTPGKTNWIMAVAACDGGAAYSSKISVDVPDVPWQYKIADSYSGTYLNTTIKQGEQSYPDHKIVLKYNGSSNKLTIGNVCAYSLAQGLDYTKDNSVNYIVGDVDIEGKTVSFPVTSSGIDAHLATGTALMPFELKDDSIYSAKEFVWTFNEDATEISFPIFGLVQGTSIRQAYDAGTFKAD